MKALRWTLLAAGLLALSACYFTTAGEGAEGDLQVTLGGSQVTVPGVTHARVWLLSGNNRIPIGDGTDYVEVDLSKLKGSTITVRGIPAGYEYVAMFSVGIKRPGWFEVKAWGETRLVTVVAGVDTEVTFALGPTQTVPFTYGSAAVMGKRIVDVQMFGGLVYAADEAGLYSGASVAALAAYTLDTLSAGYAVNSLSVGDLGAGYVDGAGARLLVNTTRGVVPRRNSGLFDEAFQSSLPVSVLDSGTFSSSGDYVYFQSDGGLGGRKQPAGAWFSADVSDLVSGQPVKDFLIVGANAYFATQLGTIRVDRNLIEGGQVAMDNFLSSTYSQFFEDIRSGGAQYFVTSLGHDGTTFHMGTANGAFTDTDPTGGAPASVVPGTEGHRILEIEATSVGPRAAYLTQNYLFVTRAGVTRRFPFVSGLPGAVTGMAWNGTTLVLSGAEGVVELPDSSFGQGLPVP